MVGTHQKDKDATERTAERQVMDKRTAESSPRIDACQWVQRCLGNSYVQRLATSNEQTEKCTGGQSCHCAKCGDHHIQAKLSVGAVDDPYEQEAAKVAEQIMRMPDQSAHVNGRESSSDIRIRRRMSDAPRSIPEASIELNQGGGQPLSLATRSFMEPRFGAEFSHVHLHTDEHASQTASAIEARAFTYGHDIWLGKGESEQDKRLMAHELTHVVQQGKAALGSEKAGSVNTSCDAAKVQRDVKRQCPDGPKTVTVDLISLRGSSRNPVDDLDFANSVFRACCIHFQLGTGLSVGAALSDAWLGGDTIMNRATARGAIAGEQSTTYDEATATFHLSGRIRAFYVEDMNPSTARATSFPGVWATGAAAPYEGMIIVTNTGAPRSLAHEIGHVLLNVDGAVHTGHPGGTDNLMEPTSTATGETLEPTQCATIFANA